MVVRMVHGFLTFAGTAHEVTEAMAALDAMRLDQPADELLHRLRDAIGLHEVAGIIRTESGFRALAASVMQIRDETDRVLSRTTRVDQDLESFEAGVWVGGGNPPRKPFVSGLDLRLGAVPGSGLVIWLPGAVPHDAPEFLPRGHGLRPRDRVAARPWPAPGVAAADAETTLPADLTPSLPEETSPPPARGDFAGAGSEPLAPPGIGSMLGSTPPSPSSRPSPPPLAVASTPPPPTFASAAAQPSPPPPPSRSDIGSAARPPAARNVHWNRNDGVGGRPSISPTVTGIRCANRHFNKPDARVCHVCGIALDRDRAMPITAPRPPLGRLLFDDGQTASLDREWMIGRDPQTAGRPSVHGLIIDDRDKSVSRSHAEVFFDGWEVGVVDLESSNGTFRWNQVLGSWQRLDALVPIRLVNGDVIAVGQRRFLFEGL